MQDEKKTNDEIDIEIQADNKKDDDNTYGCNFVSSTEVKGKIKIKRCKYISILKAKK